MDLLQSYSINFAFLSETWLPNSSNSITALIKSYGYNCHHCNQYGRGQGCALLISKKLSLNGTKPTQYNFTSFNAVSLTLNDISNTKLICVYRPPYYGSQFNTFLKEFHDFTSNLIIEGMNFVLCGDINIHWNNPNESYTYRFQDILDEIGIEVTAPLVPTHLRGNILDLIISDPSTTPHITLKSVESNLNISDHYPILFQLDLLVQPVKKPLYKIIHKRNLNDIDHMIFNSDLNEEFLKIQPNLIQSTNFETSLSHFSNAVSECLEKHAPLHTKRIKLNDSDTPPWIDSYYKSERSKRRRLEKRYKQTKTLNDWNNYRVQSIFCRNLIKSQREQFYGKSLDEIEGDQKALFSFVNNITDSKKTVDKLPTNYSDPCTLANEFNRYFIDKINRIRQTFGTASPPIPDELFEPTTTDCLIMFDPCTQDELRQIIKNSGVKVSPKDILPGPVMDKSIDTLLPYLTKLVNLSLSTGSFDGLKEAVVRPLFKNGATDCNDFSSYRPVSNLTFISKLVERVVHARLQQHMNSINYTCKTQFGYKKFHGTETLLLKLYNDILVGLDSKSGVVLVLIDLSAAFDTVDHNKLINILSKQLKIRGTALKWFRSYLTRRSQQVIIDNHLSEPLELQFGVPQGSVLGPILFNIYITSLASVFCNAGFQTLSYADDNSGYQAFSLSSANNILNTSVPQLLNDISVWMHNYYLQLNEDKTKIIVFGSKFFKNNLSIDHVTTSNGEIISIVNKVKYLGVHLDDHLSMKEHINKITSQCYLNLSKIKSIRSFLSQKQCEILINAAVTSRIDYSNALFFKLNWNDRLSKLSRIQSYSSKIILKRGRRQGLPFPERLNLLHWLPIKQRVTFKVLLLVFKCLHEKAPPLLISLLSVNAHGRHPNTLSTRMFYPTSSFGDRTFIYYAPRLWNALPANIRNIELLSEFKTKLKTHLFSNYDELLRLFNMYRA